MIFANLLGSYFSFTNLVIKSILQGGGGLVQQIRKSYSLSDLTECDPREERGNDEADDVMPEPRLIRRVPKRYWSQNFSYF